MDEQTERKKREDAVFAVIVAAVVGFLTNLLANVYYQLFVAHSATWKEIDHLQVYGVALLLLGLVGFLQFFIEDYQNRTELSPSLAKRFANFFFYRFAPGRFLRVALGIYLLIIALGFAVTIYVFVAHIAGYLVASVLAAVLAGYVAYGRFTRVR